MDDRSQVARDDLAQRVQALSRWDDDGGREPCATSGDPAGAEAYAGRLTDIELVHMRIRIIALENLMIAFLVTATGPQLELAVEMAAYITPRDGFTPHPLTISAAARMKDLVGRAAAFQANAPS